MLEAHAKGCLNLGKQTNPNYLKPLKKGLPFQEALLCVAFKKRLPGPKS